MFICQLAWWRSYGSLTCHPLQDEKYYDNQKTTAQCCRQYVDLFGMLQKVPNALGESPSLFHNTSLFIRHVY